MGFSDSDIRQIKNNGQTLDKINAQIALIKSGMVYANLKEAATVGNGILKLGSEQERYFIKIFEDKRHQISVVKFVPASGAATRMFQFLFQFLNDYDINEKGIDAYIEKNQDSDLKKFIGGLEKFPFFEEVVRKVHKIIPNFNSSSYDQIHLEFIKTMLDEDRLNYSFYPKGLFPFHKYKDYVSTAFEEHLWEAASYASSNDKANIHFTISETHHDRFSEELKHIEEDIEEHTSTKFSVSFSYQKKATDTVALTLENELFREPDGTLLFRPSGHGALLENLNDLEYDIVFIKNIDNVVVKEHHGMISDYKKMLAGILLDVQEQVFKFLHALDEGHSTDEDLNKIEPFLKDRMNVVMAPKYNDLSIESKTAYLKNVLNKPIRVCGMVKNEGEPGGGPFWVEDNDGTISLQIVESAQIASTDTNQMGILQNASHFNPVDLVCGVKNYKGDKFDLTNFVDPKTAFITNKTQSGIDIKCLELPGLWNGSMAYWNSIFVEVPLQTFNPVKTVNDLLKPPHQVSKNG